MNFSSLKANDATFACDKESAPLDYLKIQGASIKGQLRLTDFGMKNLYAQGLFVGTQTEIDGTTPISGTLDFS